MRPVVAFDVLAKATAKGMGAEFPTDRTFVRFPVRPPEKALSLDEGGGRVRLREDEGYIDVKVENGALVVRGAHVLTVEPESGNTVRIWLRDSPLSESSVSGEPTPTEDAAYGADCDINFTTP